MAKLGYSGSYKDKKKRIDFGLVLLSYQEGDLHVVYSPHLDLFGYGNTEQEAKDSFHVTLEEFLRYTSNKGCLHSELKRLGWKISGTKKKKISAPELDDLLRENEQFLDIFNNKDYRKYKEEIALPEPV